MGTRGLYCAIIDGEFKVAQYGQWDAYPEGQGKKIHEFVQHLVQEDKIEAFKTTLRKLSTVDDDYVAGLWKECGADGSGFVSMDVAEVMKDRYPQFDRDLCADIMWKVIDGSAPAVKLDTEFAADSLFCEWAYVIDMDRCVLEVFKGFQKEPHQSGRFSGYPVDEARKDNYYPVAEVAAFQFKDLPDVDTFIRLCHGSVLDRLANLPKE